MNVSSEGLLDLQAARPEEALGCFDRFLESHSISGESTWQGFSRPATTPK